MAKGFKHGAGGGTPLNFKVVGGTSAPSNPKENTIWVNTSTAITSWDFSATEPTKRSKNKNLILYPYYSTTKTENGITFTSNADGTITANGTSGTEKAEAIFDVIYSWNNTQSYPLEVGETYTLGGCPSGGGGAYSVQAVFRSASNTTSYGGDIGGGLTFTADTTKYRIGVRITIASGTKVSNLVFKPQLEKGSTATSFVKGDATGQVWFSAGTSSTAPFNALKKNNITVYPIRANQYVNGAWVGKTAKTYQNGALVDWWNGELYDSGNEYTAVTGGWVAEGKRWDSSTGGNGTPNLTKNATSMTLDRVGAPSPCIFYVKNKINLTDYKTLNYNGTLSTESTAWWHQLMVWSDFGTNASDNVVASTSLKGSGTATKSIDVSHLEGEYYIGIFIYTKPALTMYKMWLE